MNVTKIIVPGAGHNDVLFVGLEPKQAVLEFLQNAFSNGNDNKQRDKCKPEHRHAGCMVGRGLSCMPVHV